MIPHVPGRFFEFVTTANVRLSVRLIHRNNVVYGKRSSVVPPHQSGFVRDVVRREDRATSVNILKDHEDVIVVYRQPAEGFAKSSVVKNGVSVEHVARSLDRLARYSLFAQLEITIHPLVQLPAVLDG